MPGKVNTSILKDLNLIHQASDNLAKAALSKDGKLRDNKGSPITTTAALKALDHLATESERFPDVFTPEKLKEIHKVSNYLEVQLAGRDSGRIKSNKIIKSFKGHEKKLNHVKQAFQKSIASTLPSLTEDSIQVNKDGSLRIEESGKEKNLSSKSSIAQADRDWGRRNNKGTPAIELTTAESKTRTGSKADLRKFIASLGKADQEHLLQELYQKLPEESKTAEGPIKDLSAYYGIAADSVDILTEQVYANTTPTTLLTAHIAHGQHLQPDWNPEAIIPTISFKEVNGVVRPVIQVELNSISWKTPSPGTGRPSFQESHTGSYFSEYDPISGENIQSIQVQRTESNSLKEKAVAKPAPNTADKGIQKAALPKIGVGSQPTQRKDSLSKKVWKFCSSFFHKNH